MKSVPGLVTMISLPSNLTSMSMLKRIPQKEGAGRSRRPCVSAAQFRAALSCPCICRPAASLSVPLGCMCRRHQRLRVCPCHRYSCTCTAVACVQRHKGKRADRSRRPNPKIIRCSAIPTPTPHRTETKKSDTLVVGQQIIVPKNLEHRPSELSLIVVTDLVVPHWLSSPIRS